MVRKVEKPNFFTAKKHMHNYREVLKPEFCFGFFFLGKVNPGGLRGYFVFWGGGGYSIRGKPKKKKIKKRCPF